MVYVIDIYFFLISFSKLVKYKNFKVMLVGNFFLLLKYFLESKSIF